MPDDLNSRVGSLEEHQRHVWAVLDALADKQERLDNALAALADAQAEFVRETDKRFQEHQERLKEHERLFQENERRRREDLERSRELDGRIDKLVLAIGELVRRDREK